MGFLYSQLFVKPTYPTTDFSKQTVIVTGSNVGLGKEAARHFSRLNAAKIILAVRNTTQGEEAKKSIEDSTKRTGVIEVWKVDLSSFDSVKQFCKRVNAELSRLDILLLNAGIAVCDWRMSEGYEASITVNVLSTFLQLLLILPLMEKTAKMSPSSMPKPRICVVGSEVHSHVTFNSADYPEGKMLETMSVEETNKDKIDKRRYPESKLLQILVLRAVAEGMKKHDSGVILNTLNPGLCHSSLSRDGSFVLEIIKFLIARSTEVGSRTLLASAAAGEESHGQYMSDCKVILDGQPDGPNPWILKEDGQKVSKSLWAEVKGILNEIQPGVTTAIE